MAESLQIPGYKIQRKLASGAMGVVYVAVQESLGREVALKVVHQNLAEDREFLDRFEREAKSVAHLSGENVVQVLEFSRSVPTPFLSMEFVDGADLDHLLRVVRPFPYEIAILILHQVARGLETAHSMGIIHRDLKPANILLSKNGIVKIADFGLAKSLHESINISMPGQSMGTPAYMSPEQITGSAVDLRTDLFSFGVIAYELVSGQRPFQGATITAVNMSVLRDQPPAPEARSPQVQRELSEFIMKLLEKDPADRPPNVQRVRQWFERYLEDASLFGKNQLLVDFVREPQRVALDLSEKTIRRHMNRAHYLMDLGEGKSRDAIREVEIVLHLNPSYAEALEIKNRLQRVLTDAAAAAQSPPAEPAAPEMTQPANRIAPPEDAPADATMMFSVGQSPAPAESPRTAVSTSGDKPAQTPPRPPSPPVPPPPPKAPTPPPKPVPTPPRPDRTPEPEPRPARRAGRSGLWTAVAALVVVLAVAAFFVMRGGGSRNGRLEVQVVPDGATVAIPALGVEQRAPATIADLKAGRYQVRIAHDGFEPVEREVVVASGEAAALSVTLEPLARPVDLDVTSVPSGATVLLAGDSIGVTPLSLSDIPLQGRQTLHVRRAGYAEHEEEILLEGGSRRSVAVTLVPSAEEPAARTGSDAMIRFRITPASDLYVDGQLVQSSATEYDAPVQSGRRSVEARHPRLGSRKWTGSVRKGGEILFRRDLTNPDERGRVRVTAGETRGATILVNGKPWAGDQPPCVIELPVADKPYEIALQLAGHQCRPKSITMNVNPGQEGVARFELTGSGVGYVRVSTGRDGPATVLIDGAERRGPDGRPYTTPCIVPLPHRAAGYRISVARSGSMADPPEQKAAFSPGDTVSVSFHLK